MLTNIRTVNPVFVVGRQHSGNTMLALALDRSADVLSYSAEGWFFEREVELRYKDLRGRVRAVAEIVSSGYEHPADAAFQAEVEADLWSAVGTQPRAIPAPLELYVLAMQQRAERAQKRRWAQKATSYIFYADRILKALPDAKLVYLSRNPLDIAASFQTRSARDRVARMVWGWNRGTALALDYSRRFADRFLWVRYEDLVEDPERFMRRIFSFARLDWTSSALDVPYVNRSEAPYELSSQDLGIQQDRRFYFQRRLDQNGRDLVLSLVQRRLLEATYPELVAWLGASMHVPWRRALRDFAGTATSLIESESAVFRGNPLRFLDRLRHRVL